MRKDRLSFIVLVAEIAGIVLLHSLKSAPDKSVTVSEVKPVKKEAVSNTLLQNPGIFLHSTMILPIFK